MKRLLMVTTVVLVLSFMLVSVAAADDGETAVSAQPTSVSVAVVLAPLVVAATAIERVIEMLFSWYESLVLSVGGVVGLGGSYVKWARQQVTAYRAALINTTDQGEISRLEELLLDAQQRLEDSLKSEPYVHLKRAAAVLLSIALGLVTAFLTRLQMLSLLGIKLTTVSAAGATPSPSAFLTTMDMVITGVVIGTGSAPVHSLIGILQNTKEAIDQLRALAQGKSIASIAAILPSAEEPGAFGKRGTVAPAGAEGVPSRVELQRTARRLLG